MILRELEHFSSITIQLHDNPDADALGSGYALYKYFKSKGIETRLVYCGRYQIQRSNLLLFIEQLQIPIEYVQDIEFEIPGLLLTVDCQYGAGNVTKLTANSIAVIDHHQIEADEPLPVLHDIYPNMGSCATVIWRMLKHTDYPIEDDIDMGTALYYALYMDTNQFSELVNPMDRDMLESLVYDKSLFMRLKHANISLKELEIAGIALIKTLYNEQYHYAVLQARPCDPNLLGLISDFVIQVDSVDICVVYNTTDEGLKFSVRSCSREIKANELALFLTHNMGSGGGHMEKAGGFISKRKYDKHYSGIDSEKYLSNRLVEYFESYDVIDLNQYQVNLEGMELFCKRDIPFAYIHLDEIVPIGTEIVIRSIEGDRNCKVKKDMYFLMGKNGEMYPVHTGHFLEEYRCTDEKFSFSEAYYSPHIKVKSSGQIYELIDFVKTSYVKKKKRVYAKMLTKNVKVFSKNVEETYILGEVGDYLVVPEDSPEEVYVLGLDMFYRVYKEDKDT